MRVEPTAIADILEITPQIHNDPRGFFLESWNAQRFAAAGLDLDFVQDNHSHSTRGVLRGLHYQLRRPQGKLIRVVTGRVFDVAVDLRRGSPTFGRWVGVWLGGENHKLLWIPPGFAHGFYVASARADFLYKCTDFYSPEDERTIAWNDPDLAIDWPIPQGESALVSEADRDGRLFSEAEYYK